MCDIDDTLVWWGSEWCAGPKVDVPPGPGGRGWWRRGWRWGDADLSIGKKLQPTGGKGLGVEEGPCWVARGGLQGKAIVMKDGHRSMEILDDDPSLLCPCPACPWFVCKALPDHEVCGADLGLDPAMELFFFLLVRESSPFPGGAPLLDHDLASPSDQSIRGDQPGIQLYPGLLEGKAPPLILDGFELIVHIKRITVSRPSWCRPEHG